MQSEDPGTGATFPDTHEMEEVEEKAEAELAPPPLPPPPIVAPPPPIVAPPPPIVAPPPPSEAPIPAEEMARGNNYYFKPASPQEDGTVVSNVPIPALLPWLTIRSGDIPDAAFGSASIGTVRGCSTTSPVAQAFVHAPVSQR